MSCPTTGPVVEEIAETYPERFAALTMHVNDDAYSIPWSQDRLDVFYGLAAAVPTFMVDARRNSQPGDYWDDVEQRLGDSTDVTLELSGDQHSGSTWDLTARVCREGGGNLPARVFIAPTLDEHPELPRYTTNVLMQKPEYTNVTIPGGGCVDVTHRFTFDSLSMSNSSDIAIIAWAQAQAASAPTDVYQAGIMRWPFPTASRLTTIEITPAQAEVSVGESVVFTAVGKDQHGAEVALSNPTWDLDYGDGSLEPLSGSATTTFTGTEPGWIRIWCTEDGVTGEAFVNVRETPELTSIEIDPSPATVAVGSEISFTATGRDQFGEVFALDNPSWSISGTGDGSFDPATGTTTTLTGTYPGSATVTCSEGEVSATATVEVTGDEPRLAVISVSPDPVSLQIGEEVELTASGTDQYGRSIELVDPAWHVEGDGYGDFDPVDGSAVTTFTATTAGSAQLICTDDGIEGFAAASLSGPDLPAPRKPTRRVTPS